MFDLLFIHDISYFESITPSTSLLVSDVIGSEQHLSAHTHLFSLYASLAMDQYEQIERRGRHLSLCFAKSALLHYCQVEEKQ